MYKKDTEDLEETNTNRFLIDVDEQFRNTVFNGFNREIVFTFVQRHDKLNCGFDFTLISKKLIRVTKSTERMGKRPKLHLRSFYGMQALISFFRHIEHSIVSHSVS